MNTTNTGRKQRRAGRAVALLLSVAIPLLGADRVFEPEPLSKQSIQRAAKSAGFAVEMITADIPSAASSRFPFVTFDYDDPLLAELRRTYDLEAVVKSAPDEWAAQLLLKEWVAGKIPGGDPRSSPRSALEVLKLAGQGEKFYCTQYAITYVEAAQALGWQARKIGVDRKHGPAGWQSTHHGVAEVWSNQFRKWVVIDAQSNLHFEKDGVPLSAWEIRAEWLTNRSADVKHMVGAPPRMVHKNPAMVWSVPDPDETATYFWIYVEDHAAFASHGAKKILPLAFSHDGEIWYQNSSQKGISRLHIGYSKDLFLPTRRIEDAYWTVGIVEAHVYGIAGSVLELGLDAYCPNLEAFEMSQDGATWDAVENRDKVQWPLKEGWNTLRLRTRSRGGVVGPETAAVMFLKAAMQ